MVRAAMLWNPGTGLPLAIAGPRISPSPDRMRDSSGATPAVAQKSADNFKILGKPMIVAVAHPPDRRVGYSVGAGRGPLPIALAALKPVASPSMGAASLAAAVTFERPRSLQVPLKSQPTGAAQTPAATATRHYGRLSGSAWVLARSGSGQTSLGTGGTLGGSQAGFRLFYRPGPSPIALTAGVSAPLASPTGREAAVGISLRGRNGGVIFERRVALGKGGRNDFALTAFGGVNDIMLPLRFKLDGYGQTGVVGIRTRDLFFDAAVRVLHPVTEIGKARVAVGAALSGGAQPHVARIDIGPELVADLPVGRTGLRVAAGWRERIVGNAQPGSGPSVTLGTDF